MKRYTDKKRNPKWKPTQLLKLANSAEYSADIGECLQAIAAFNSAGRSWDYWRTHLGEYERQAGVIETPILRMKLSPVILFTAPDWVLGWQHISISSDIDVILSIMGAVTAGRLKDLLKCSCGTYFFRRRIDQKYHSAECRQRAFRSTDAWKAYHRDKSKEYYHLQKNKNVK